MRAQRPRELRAAGLAVTPLALCTPAVVCKKNLDSTTVAVHGAGDLLQVLLRQEVWAQGLRVRQGGHPEHGQGGIAGHQTRGVSTPAPSRGPPVRQAPPEISSRGAGAASPFLCTGRGPQNCWAPLLCPQMRKPSQYQ